jgi:hypothetical protein
MNTSLRALLLVPLLVAGAASATRAQVDSALAVSHAGASLLRVNVDGHVGIGTANPTRQLHVVGTAQVTDSLFAGPTTLGNTLVNGPNGFVATGDYHHGSIPATGDGIRMMWYGALGAFRGGRANGNDWDNPNVGEYSVAMGLYPRAGGFSAVALGEAVSASAEAAVALGVRANASGLYSVAIGDNVSTNGYFGAVVIGDGSTGTITDATAAHQFTFRSAGGVRWFTNGLLTAGVQLAAGGNAWSTVSDRNRKEHFLAIDGEELLGRIRLAPVSTWNYRSQDHSIRHMGPMAQDFYAAFGLGEDSLLISTVDIDGVNLAAAQALERRTAAASQAVAALRMDNAAQRAEIADLRQRIARLEQALERQKPRRRSTRPR